MPTNSQILIDGFISDEFSKQTEYSSKGDYFELLASSRYMAPYDLDDDEIAEGAHWRVARRGLRCYLHLRQQLFLE